MPILGEEPSIHPPELLDGFTAECTDRVWWCAHTKARQEKSLARDLLQRKIPFYLPLVAREHLIRGKRVQSFVPLFGGYVFLFATEEERIQCLATQRIAHMLPVEDGERLTNDLRDVCRLIQADAPLTVERRLAPGQLVRIKGGALLGMEGTVVTRRGKSRLVVAVDFLQQGVSVEVDDALLEPS